MSVIFTVNSVKGGSLKTTNVVNLAACFAARGYRTLVVDLDGQGNATTALGVDCDSCEKTMTNVLIPTQSNSAFPKFSIQEVIIGISENLYLAPANLNLISVPDLIQMAVSRETLLKKSLHSDAVQKIFDVVIIDNSPTIDVLTRNAFAAADYLIGSSTFEYFSLKGVDLLMDTFDVVKEELNPGLEFYGTIAGKNNRTIHAQECRELLESEYKLIGSLPTSVKASDATVEGRPLVYHDASNPVSQAYISITDKIIDEMIKNKKLLEISNHEIEEVVRV